ncbi:MAG: hypothetical protein QOF30_1121 [Acidimicrobiaceae bacterium]|jgi:hypothetical protein|nr:hypothetical protein [Acidimicrobiaceae bacterium]
MHTVNRADFVPGAIVHISQFPFEERPESKSRFGLIIRRKGPDVTVRGIYTHPRPGYAPIPSNRGTRLDHDSYLGNRLVNIRVHKISHACGEAAFDYDPFGDFAA